MDPTMSDPQNDILNEPSPEMVPDLAPGGKDRLDPDEYMEEHVSNTRVGTTQRQVDTSGCIYVHASLLWLWERWSRLW